jgi:ribonuclease-3
MKEINNIILKKTGYKFKNNNILKIAMTHKSVKNLENNEKLELLGDSILNLVILYKLHNTYKEYNEGTLSLLKSKFIEKKTLLEIGKELNLKKHIIIKKNSNISKLDTLIANAVEAIIGGILIESGIKAAFQATLSLYKDKIKKIKHTNLKDSKTKLQELLQKKKKKPIYITEKIIGLDHKLKFLISCNVEESKTTAFSETKKEAQKKAAKKMLKILLKNNNDH